METNPIYTEKNELSYRTLGRFLGLATTLKTYREFYEEVPSVKTNVILDMLIDIINDYDRDIAILDNKLADKET